MLNDSRAFKEVMRKMCCFDIMLSFGISEAMVALALVALSLARGMRVLPLWYHSSHYTYFCL